MELLNGQVNYGRIPPDFSMSLTLPVMLRFVILTLEVFGVLTVIPLWYFMLSRHFLHNNFRTITLMATFGIQLAEIFALVVLLGQLMKYDTTKVTRVLTRIMLLLYSLAVSDKYLFEEVKPIVRYGGLLFYISIFFLGVERAVAVIMVSKYEKCVSSIITVAIIVVLVSITGLVGTILNMLIAVHNDLPKMIFVTVYAVLCFIIAISLVVYRRIVPRITHGSSLQKRFQDKENGRTLPIYTCISANELLVSAAISSIYAVLSDPKHHSKETEFILNEVVDIIDAYRMLFINVAILCNWFIWNRNQKRVFIDDHTDGDQYFRQLHSSWNPAGKSAVTTKVVKS